MNLIGLRIRNLRKQKGMTLKDVSHGIVSIPYLANIENGVKTASIETLMHLARRLEVPEETLLVNEEETNQIILEEFQAIFKLIVFSNTENVETKLNAIADNINLLQQSPATELGFYSLQACYYYKIWEFSKAEEIEIKYLTNNEKRIQENFPSYLLNYYYYSQAVKHLSVTCDYDLAETYWKKCIETSNDNTLQAVFHINMCICFICQGAYESALKHIKKSWILAKNFSNEEYEFKGTLLYFFGYVYYQIGFLTESKKRFKQAIELFSVYPKFKSRFYFLIRFRLAEIEKSEGNEATFNEDIATLYNEIIRYKKINSTFDNNVYLVITELMVIFAENGFVEQATALKEIMSEVRERVIELDYFIEYTETLLLYHQNQQASYEKNMMDFLKRIDESNDPILINRVKKHASTHFAKETKYKMAYLILS
ncbi:helix-turn-helix transcriptional regulator [Listeria welshimeri]|nr:helix-turn-helix transcriptional regulator [Listeria welshimeri]MBC2356428.1 helix-turn-helix transcriptional regulator [Listeria welshimeri]